MAFFISPTFVFGNGKQKNVECSIEVMPNYIWHLFALADLWDKGKSRYYEIYGNTVSQPDIDYLHKNRSLIVWGNGLTAPLTGVLFFQPFRNEISPSEYFDYLDCFTKGLKNSDWKDFFDKYCPECDRLAEIPRRSNEEIALFEKISEIIKRNYPAYKNVVWPEVQPALNEYGEKINSYFSDKDIINRWEEELNMSYEENTFYPVLTVANAIDNLPSANNLSRSRNNFGVSNKALDWTIDLIIHEIGIFILSPSLNRIRNDNELKTEFNRKNNVIYQSIESFIEKKKGDMTGKRVTWKGKMHGNAIYNFSFFFEYYDKNNTITDPELLIRNAIKAYNRKYNIEKSNNTNDLQ